MYLSSEVCNLFLLTGDYKYSVDLWQLVYVYVFLWLMELVKCDFHIPSQRGLLLRRSPRKSFWQLGGTHPPNPGSQQVLYLPDSFCTQTYLSHRNDPSRGLRPEGHSGVWRGCRVQCSMPQVGQIPAQASLRRLLLLQASHSWQQRTLRRCRIVWVSALASSCTYWHRLAHRGRQFNQDECCRHILVLVWPGWNSVCACHHIRSLTSKVFRSLIALETWSQWPSPVASRTAWFWFTWMHAVWYLGRPRKIIFP